MIRCRPPLFLLKTAVPCWKCDATVNAIGIAANHVEGIDEDGEFVPYGDDPYEFFSLSYITAIPDDLIAELHTVSLHFKRAASATAGQAYFANHCSECGAMQGDHYVHSEPDMGFFKTSDEGLASIFVATLNFAESLTTEASLGSSSGICHVVARHLKLPERPQRAARRTKRSGKN